jgi:hypothetical protein
MIGIKALQIVGFVVDLQQLFAMPGAERQRRWREAHRGEWRQLGGSSAIPSAIPKPVMSRSNHVGGGVSPLRMQPLSRNTSTAASDPATMRSDYVGGGVSPLAVTSEFHAPELSPNTFRFQHPCTILVAGPSGSGKTSFVTRLLLSPISMFEPEIQDIVVFYAEWQPDYVEWRRRVQVPIEFIEGMPTEDYYDTVDSNTRRLLIVDDQMQKAAADGMISKLFTRGSHHRNLSIILMVQNMFEKGLRTISLNSNYMVLFKTPRDSSQIGALGRQLYPHKPGILQEAFDDATKEPYQYLLADLKQETPDWLRLKTLIFPDETLDVYVPAGLVGRAPVYKP